MTRRPAVTLIEVLISMFIMAIGMLALLVLFPLGAVSMGQALKDDRCASTAAMAENVSIAIPTMTAGVFGIRNDPNVMSAFVADANANLPLLVYVDPYGMFPPLGNLGGMIPRVSPSFVTSTLLADRWFSLPDDITFLENGLADTVKTGGVVDRGRRYSYAYLLRQFSPNLIQLYAVVYSGRPVNTLTLETTLMATGSAGTNSIVINAMGTTIKRGGWVLDTTNPKTSPNPPAAPGYFYRVTNVAESGGATVVELQTNLIGNVTQLTIMDNVAEVFDKGTSWRP